MIKIIKKGVKPKKYKTIYIFTCKNCKCEFEFEESDCNSVTTEKSINGKKMAVITCPCCHEDVKGDLNRCASRSEVIADEPIDPDDNPNTNIDDNDQWVPSLCKCPECGSNNTLRNNSFMVIPWPAQEKFKCRDCGHRWTVPKQLINPKVYDPWDNEHCKNCPHRTTIGDSCSCCPYNPIRITYRADSKENA